MNNEFLYYSFVLLTLIYLLFKYFKNFTQVLIILCFYSGLATFLGKSIENPYKILLACLSVYILLKKSTLSHLKNKEKFFLFAYLVFSASFIYSSYINDDSINLTFSQYGKYLTPVCLFFILNHISRNHPDSINEYKAFVFSILTMQIFLSIVKVFTIGIREATVGSISYWGGGEATTFPVLGFMLLWMHKNGDIRKKEWFYILLLLITGFASEKRAIWFIMPVFIIIFLYFVPKKINAKKVAYFIPLIPLVFYAGVRLNPTLNKENKIGGEFDLQYVSNYVMDYNFGKTSKSSSIKLGKGRGGATLLIWNRLLYSNTSFHEWWGNGLAIMYTTDYGTFEKRGFGLNSKGAATGIFQTYVTSGFVGILTTLLFIISIIRLVDSSRIRIAIGIFLFYDYLFYSGLVLRNPALFILLFIVIILSNLKFTGKMNSSDQIPDYLPFR